MPTKAVTKLQPSRLLDQNQLMVTDVELNTLNLALKGSASLSVVEAVTGAEVSRTIEGSSTVTITLFDRDREILRSGRVSKGVDINIDGLWFRLAGVDKNGDVLTLTFEDREVALLRTYMSPFTVRRAKLSRQRFIKRLVDEVKEMKIPFVCPEIDKIVKTDPIIDTPQTHGETIYARNAGFPPVAVPGGGSGFTADITVNGIPASGIQMDNTDRVLRVGQARGASYSCMVAAVEVINEESGALNLSGSLDGLSAGLFQQIEEPHRYAWGTHAQVTNIEWAANRFFDGALAAYASNPAMTPEYIAMNAQVAGNQEARIIPIWRKFREEAARTVARWGVVVGTHSAAIDAQTTIEEHRLELHQNNQDVTTEDLAQEFKNLGSTQGSSSPIIDALKNQSKDYQFTRGQLTYKDGQPKLRPESSWACSGRLADEVNWRRFVVSGTFYYVSEPYLFRSKPVMRITEDTPGIISIDGNYLTYTKNAAATVTAHIGRWEAPPGSMIEIFDCGLISGRWLVTEISRNLFNTTATINLKKPRPTMPEPNLDQASRLIFNPTEASAVLGSQIAGVTANEDKRAADSFTTSGTLEELRRLVTNNSVTFDHSNDRQGLMLSDQIVRKDKTLVTVDPAIIAFLAWAGNNFGPIRVGSLVGTHPQYVDGSNNTRESRHWTGHAVDIASISGKRVDDGTAKEAVRAFMTAVGALQESIRPNQQICNGCGREDTEIQTLQLDAGLPKGGHWVSDHIDHVHIGY